MKKGMWYLRQQPGAIAGFGVGAARAPVAKVDQRFEPLDDDAVRGAALHVGDEADPAGVVLKRRVV